MKNIFVACILIAANLQLACNNHRSSGERRETVVALHLPKNYLKQMPMNEHLFLVATPSQRSGARSVLEKIPDINIDDHLCISSISDDRQETKDSAAECIKKFEIVSKSKIACIVNAPNEDSVDLGASLRSEFSASHGMKHEESVYFTDKAEMKAKIASNDPSVPMAKQIMIDYEAYHDLHNDAFSEKISAEIASKLGSDWSKLIIKPVGLSGSAGIESFINTPDAIDKITSHFDGSIRHHLSESAFIIEEFIEGKVLRFDGLMQGGQVAVNFTSEYLVPPKEFYQEAKLTMYTLITDEEKVAENLEFASKVMKALEYQDGVFHLEAIRNKKTGTLYFLENAARPGGGLSETLRQVGYNPIEAFVNHQLNLPFSFDIDQQKVFNVVEIKAPSFDSDSLRILELDPRAAEGYESYDQSISWLTSRKQIFSRTLGLLSFIHEDEDVVLSESREFAKNFTARVKMESGEYYFQESILKDGVWSKPFSAE